MDIRVLGFYIGGFSIVTAATLFIVIYIFAHNEISLAVSPVDVRFKFNHVNRLLLCV